MIILKEKKPIIENDEITFDDLASDRDYATFKGFSLEANGHYINMGIPLIVRKAYGRPGRTDKIVYSDSSQKIQLEITKAMFIVKVDVKSVVLKGVANTKLTLFR